MSDGKRIWVCPVHGPVEPGQVGVKRRCLVQPVSRGVVGEPICGEPCEPFIAESERQAHIRDLEAQLEAADRLAEAADGSFGQDGGTNRLAKALAAYRAQKEGSDGG